MCSSPPVHFPAIGGGYGPGQGVCGAGLWCPRLSALLPGSRWGLARAYSLSHGWSVAHLWIPAGNAAKLRFCVCLVIFCLFVFLFRKIKIKNVYVLHVFTVCILVDGGIKVNFIDIYQILGWQLQMWLRIKHHYWGCWFLCRFFFFLSPLSFNRRLPIDEWLHSQDTEPSDCQILKDANFVFCIWPMISSCGGNQQYQAWGSFVI